MKRKTRFLVYAAILAALYVALTYLQNMLLPGTTSMAIQLRASEALCIFAFFTPAAVVGLTVGCFLFNLSYAHTMFLDILVGTGATLLATGGMYLSRRWTVKGYPLLGMLLPAVCNGVLVGWELDLYMGGGFWLNALYVALGEAIVLLTLGTALFYALKVRHLDERLRNI